MLTKAHTAWMTLLLSVALLVGPVSAQAPAKPEPLAEVEGQVITVEEVERAAAGALWKIEDQLYRVKRRALERLINQRLFEREAARRGITVAQLMDAEVTQKAGRVTEEEVEQTYEASKGQRKGTEVEVRQQVRTSLQMQKLLSREQELVESLRAQAKVLVHLQAPPVFRAEVSTDGAPFKGAAAAPVTIVKFEDFHCPFCRRVQATLVQLLRKYDGQVKVIHRDLPLDQLHPQARRLHEAARCASEQEKFWLFQDVLYARAPVKPEQLTAIAQEVELDLPAFEQCLTSGKYTLAVQKDVEEGARLGVTGTPTFFVNGRILEGAQQLENFVQMIDEELTRAHW